MAKKPTPEQFQQVLNIMKVLSDLKEPERRAKRDKETRAFTLEKLKEQLGATAARQKPEFPGLTQAAAAQGRGSNRLAEELEGIDPANAEEVAAAKQRAGFANKSDADFLMAMANFLHSKGDPAAAQFAQQASDVLNPPTPEVIRKRSARRKAAAFQAKKDATGSFRVEGGPRSGFKAEGTPDEILRILLESRPKALKEKFGQHTNTGTKPVSPPKGKVDTKKKKGKTRTVFGAEIPEEQIVKDPIIEAVKFFFGQSESDKRARKGFFGPGRGPFHTKGK